MNNREVHRPLSDAVSIERHRERRISSSVGSLSVTNVTPIDSQRRDYHRGVVARRRLTSSSHDSVLSPEEAQRGALIIRERSIAESYELSKRIHFNHCSIDMAVMIMIGSEQPVFNVERYKQLIYAFESLVVQEFTLSDETIRLLRRFLIPENWLVDDYAEDLARATAIGVDKLSFITGRLEAYPPSRASINKKLYEDVIFGMMLVLFPPFRQQVIANSSRPDRLSSMLWPTTPCAPGQGVISLTEMMDHMIKAHNRDVLPHMKFQGNLFPTDRPQRPDDLPLFSSMYVTIDVFAAHLRRAILVDYGLPFASVMDIAKRQARGKEDEQLRIALQLTGLVQGRALPRPCG
jgi:hypothetical protein